MRYYIGVFKCENREDGIPRISDKPVRHELVATTEKHVVAFCTFDKKITTKQSNYLSENGYLELLGNDYNFVCNNYLKIQKIDIDHSSFNRIISLEEKPFCENFKNIIQSLLKKPSVVNSASFHRVGSSGSTGSMTPDNLSSSSYSPTNQPRL